MSAPKAPGDSTRRVHPDPPIRIILRVNGDAAGTVEEHDMGDLLFGGLIPGKTRARVRDVLIQGFDLMLLKPPLMEGATGFEMDEFEHLLAGFTRGIMDDASRPFFANHDPLSCGAGDGCRMKISYLLLAVLMYAGGRQVQGGLAAILDADVGTATAYLGYGMAVCGRVVYTPERAAARLADTLDRGAYAELELEAPGLVLYIDRAEIHHMQTGHGGPAGELVAMGKVQDVLAVRTGQGTVIAVWEAPADTTPLDALERYVSGRGRFLGELVRQMPNGVRWSVVPGRFLLGEPEDPEGGRHCFPVRTGDRGTAYGGACDMNGMMQLVWGMANSHVRWMKGGDPGVQTEQPPGRRDGAGPGSAVRQAAARTDATGNPYLEELIRQCSTGGSEEEMRGAALARLDDIISDVILLVQTTGQSVQEFQGILHRFTGEVAYDESRPLFDDPRAPGGPHEPGPRHLLLMVLMNSRCGPVLDGLAAVFGVDHGTAAEYLEYGRSVCYSVADLPDKAAGRLMDAAERGAYGEMEQEAPGLVLAATFEKIRPLPRDGVPPGILGGPYNRLLVFTGNSVMIGTWTEPEGAAGGAEVFRRYISGVGGHLAGLARRLPDGRRWIVRYGGGLDGIEEMLPGADVGPAPDPEGTKMPGVLRHTGRKSRTGPETGARRLSSGTAGPGAGRGPPEGVLLQDPAGLGPDLEFGGRMTGLLGLDPGEDGRMLLDGRPGRPRLTAGGAMVAVLLQLRGRMTLDGMERFYGIDRKTALAGVRVAMDYIHDTLLAKPVDITGKLKAAPPDGAGVIRGDRLYFGCITVPLCRPGEVSGPHKKAILVADSSSRAVGLGDTVDGGADRKKMIREYLSGRGREIARLIRHRKDDLTVYAGSRLVELADELPGCTVKRYKNPGHGNKGPAGADTLEGLAEDLARSTGVLDMTLDAFDEYGILGSYDGGTSAGLYDHEWYDLDRTLQVLGGMVNTRMYVIARDAIEKL